MANKPQMKNKLTNNDFSVYAGKIADYIDMEYGGFDNDGAMSDDEKYTVKNIIVDNFNKLNSVNNAANDIMTYLRDNNIWKKRQL